jgi:nucleoside-diphosphate-sugar epimerase
MKIMIIGGNGFIGSHLATHLIEQGHEVVVVDRRDALVRQPRKPREYQSRFLHIDRNIYTDQDAQEIFEAVNADSVIFCASTVPDEIQAAASPSLTMQTLTVLTSSFYAAKAAGVKRFVYLSSVPTSLLFLHKPRALLHHLAEEFLYNEATESGMDVMVLKLTDVYAPGTTNVRHNFLNVLLSTALLGTPLVVNPQDRADFVYIGDAVLAITGAVEQGSKEIHLSPTAAASHKGQPAVYYVSSGQPTMNLVEVIAAFNTVANALQFPTVRYVQQTTHDMPTDMAYEESDSAALILLTGHGEDPLSLEQGLNKMIAMEQLLLSDELL